MLLLELPGEQGIMISWASVVLRAMGCIACGRRRFVSVSASIFVGPMISWASVVLRTMGGIACGRRRASAPASVPGSICGGATIAQASASVEASALVSIASSATAATLPGSVSSVEARAPASIPGSGTAASVSCSASVPARVEGSAPVSIRYPAAAEACPSSASVSVAGLQCEQVFITKTGRKWHRHNNRSCLRKATAVWTTSLADAVCSGLTKCRVCG